MKVTNVNNTRTYSGPLLVTHLTFNNDEPDLIPSCDSGNSHSVSCEVFWKKPGLVPSNKAKPHPLNCFP